MKYGVSLKIDVTKISKEHMFKGAKGTYIDAVVFIDVDQKDQYGNSGMIVQDWKDAPKGQTPILGSAKVFWGDGSQQSAPQQRPASQQQRPMVEPDFDDSEIPF